MQAAAELHQALARDTGIAAAREDTAARQLHVEVHQAALDTERRRDAARIHNPSRMRLRLVAGGAQ